MPFKYRDTQLQYFKDYNKTRGGSKYWHGINMKRARDVAIYQRNNNEALFIYALDVICKSENHECISCPERDLRCLHFDHKNGGGSKDKKAGFMGDTMYRWIIKNPIEARKKFQILCANCNFRKKWEQREVKYKYE